MNENGKEVKMDVTEEYGMMSENMLKEDSFSMSIFNSSQLEDIASELNEDSSEINEDSSQLDENLSSMPRKIWRSGKPKKPFNGYNYEGGVYTMNEVQKFLELSFAKAPLQRSTSRILYYNVASSFDIAPAPF